MNDLLLRLKLNYIALGFSFLTTSDQTDRTAILLRYFESKSLREVGEALGASEDAAQKRVQRAVERLREFFLQHKIKVGATGLIALVTSNAIQAAPPGLAALVTTSAMAACVSASTVVTVTKAIAMTTLQKSIIAVVVTGARSELGSTRQLSLTVCDSRCKSSSKHNRPRRTRQGSN